MASYTVENKSGVTIFWRDGSWLSGDLRNNDIKTVETDHDADVTMFGKRDGVDQDWGRVWIHRNRKLVVTGDKKWCLG